MLASPLRPLNDRIWFEVACHVACLLNIAENLFLLLLTSIASTENYGTFLEFIAFFIAVVDFFRKPKYHFYSHA